MWTILIAGFYAVGDALRDLLAGKPWDKGSRFPGLVYVGLLDLQFLVGAVVYATSPNVKEAWHDMGAAMKVKELRFFAVEHAFGMAARPRPGPRRLRSSSRRPPPTRLKYRRAAVFYGLSLLIVLKMIPWWR